MNRYGIIRTATTLPLHPKNSLVALLPVGRPPPPLIFSYLSPSCSLSSSSLSSFLSTLSPSFPLDRLMSSRASYGTSWKHNYWCMAQLFYGKSFRYRLMDTGITSSRVLSAMVQQKQKQPGMGLLLQQIGGDRSRSYRSVTTTLFYNLYLTNTTSHLDRTVRATGTDSSTADAHQQLQMPNLQRTLLFPALPSLSASLFIPCPERNILERGVHTTRHTSSMAHTSWVIYTQLRRYQDSNTGKYRLSVAGGQEVGGGSDESVGDEVEMLRRLDEFERGKDFLSLELLVEALSPVMSTTVSPQTTETVPSIPESLESVCVNLRECVGKLQALYVRRNELEGVGYVKGNEHHVEFMGLMLAGISGYCAAGVNPVFIIGVFVSIWIVRRSRRTEMTKMGK
eukprot:GHVQ01026186.1.p1 GENE.GHVQ01026186.1~~GHVQ01026186.1.p1  ORF type:complete len:411 (-),score=62.40 GHVQ01026186.1:1466-2653(-)